VLQLLWTITRLRPQLFTSFSADLHLAASSALITHALSVPDLEQEAIDRAWRNVVGLGLKSRKPEVWEAVAGVWAAVSERVDVSEDVTR
jgi:hypothetical protein